MTAIDRQRRWARLLIGLMQTGALSVVTSGVVTTAAGATSTPASSAASSLVYSTDAGATWSAHVNAAPGEDVLARIFFDNNTGATVAGASVTTTLPSGFTLNGASTIVCLSPGTTDPTAGESEQVCNTSPGQGGAIDQAAVWSNTTLAISPSAGLFGQATGQRRGPLPFGRRRFLSLDNCDYLFGVDHFSVSISTSPSEATFGAPTMASNLAASVGTCRHGTSTYTSDLQNSGVQNIELLGNRYLNLTNCDYQRGVDHYTDSISTSPLAGYFSAGTRASNTVSTTPVCGPGGTGYVPVPARTGVQNIDLVSNRFLHLVSCTYLSGLDRYTDTISSTPTHGFFRAGTTASNNARAWPVCGLGGSGYRLAPLLSGIEDIDLLDTSRGQGFVQFQMTAPSPSGSTSYHQTARLTPTVGTLSSGAGTIVVDPSISTPLGQPEVAAGVVLIAAAALLVTRARRGVA